MALSLLIPAALAGSFAAAAIAFAPLASADDKDVADPGRDRKSSQQAAAADRGPASKTGPSRADRPGSLNDVPKGWSNEAQWNRPGSNIFGSLPKPPIFAMD